MNKKEAIEKYPMLIGLSQIDLIFLGHESIRLGDIPFKNAIDALLKPTPPDHVTKEE